MKIFEDHSFNEFRERVKGKDFKIASAIYEAISKGYSRNVKQVTAFNFRQKGSDDIYGFSLSREQWPLALSTCLDIYAEQELYEECIKIKNIINRLSQEALAKSIGMSGDDLAKTLIQYEVGKAEYNKKKRSKSI